MAAIDYAYAQATTRDSQTGVTWKTVLTLSGSNLTASKKYLIIVCAHVDSSDNGESARIRVQSSGATITDSEENIELNTTTTRHCYLWFDQRTTGASPGDITLQVAGNVAGHTVGADQMAILAINLEDDLTENTDWYYSHATTDHVADTAWETTNVASVSVTGNDTDPWLILCSSRMTIDDLAVQYESGIDYTGTSDPEFYAGREGEQANDLYILTTAMVHVAASGGTTYAERYRLDAAGNGGETRTDGKVFTLNLAAFDQNIYSHSTTGGTLADHDVSAFGTRLAAITLGAPSASTAVFLLSNWGYEGTAGRYAAARQQTSSGTDLPATQTTDDYELEDAWDSTDRLPVSILGRDTGVTVGRTYHLDAASEIGDDYDWVTFVAFTAELAGATAAEVTEDASARIQVPAEVTEAASARIALQSEATEDVSARIALQSEATEDASARVKVNSQVTDAVSLRTKLLSEVTDATSARIALQSETTEPGSARIALPTEVTDDASLRAKLPSEVTDTVTARLALQSENTRPASIRTALQSESTEDLSARIQVPAEVTDAGTARIKLLSEATEDATARIKLLGQATEDATARVKLLSEATEDVSARIALQSQVTEAASVRAKQSGEVTAVASVRIGGAPFDLVDSTYIAASGEPTTAQLNPPSGKTESGNFETGRIQDDENPADAIDLTADAYTEIEWCIEANDTAEDAATYEFRITKNGTPIAYYTKTPLWTISEATAGEVTEDASARIQASAEATDTASARIKLLSQATDDATARIALQSEATEDVSARVALQSEVTEDVSARVKLLSESTEDVTARIALQAEATEDISARIKLLAEATEDVTARVKLLSEITDAGTARIAQASESTAAASARISTAATAAEVTEDASARINVSHEATEDVSARIALAAEVAEDVSARVALPAEATEPATARIGLQAEATEDASARVALRAEATEDASARVALGSEATEDASARIAQNAEITEPTSARIALRTEIADDASARIALRGTATEPATTRVAQTGETVAIASVNIELPLLISAVVTSITVRPLVGGDISVSAQIDAETEVQPQVDTEKADVQPQVDADTETRPTVSPDRILLAGGEDEEL
jgi:hypothetical protein